MSKVRFSQQDQIQNIIWLGLDDWFVYIRDVYGVLMWASFVCNTETLLSVDRWSGSPFNQCICNKVILFIHQIDLLQVVAAGNSCPWIWLKKWYKIKQITKNI